MMVRLIRRNPLFCASVVAILALGIGTSTVIFTAVEAFLLRPLPVLNPERLARLGVEASATHVTFDHSSVYARVLEEEGKSFDSVFSFFPLDAAVDTGRHVEIVSCEVVSDNYFTALGLHPERGAFFRSGTAESLPAVISHALWHNAFRGHENAVGSGIRVRGAAFTVSGVAPSGFGGLDLERRADIWVPQSAWKAWTGNPNTQSAPAQIFVRLRGGVQLAEAEAEVRVLYPAMVDADLADAKQVSGTDVGRQKARRVVLVSAEGGVSAMRKQLSTATPALLGAVAALLLLVGANIGGLMLVRGESRRTDIALRLSLGASRWRIVWTTLSESLVLSGVGALVGYMLALYSGPLLMAFLPARRPLNIDLNPDSRVLAFTIAVAVGVALFASIAPASSAGRTDLIQVLGKGGRVSAPVAGRSIVTIQVALATVLTAGSVSLVSSLGALRNQDPGFDGRRLIIAVLDPRMAGVKQEQLPPVYGEILRRARRLPGAADASLGGAPLMRGVGFKNTMGPAGSRLTAAERLNVSLNYASEAHFHNLGMTLVAGRNLVLRDLDIHPTPTVVTESLAKLFFSGLDPLGREFGPAGPDGFARPQFRIVGVVHDVKYRSMREIAPPTFFTAFRGDVELVTLYVRTHIDEAEMMGQIRAMLATVGPGLAPVNMASMEQEIETSLWQERMLSFLSGVFAVVAVLIAGIGLFVLIAFSLARRTREVGIRVAVGATPRSVAALFATYAATAVGPGILLGVAAFAITRRGLEPLVFGAGAGGAEPLATSAFVVAFTTMIAAAVPVVRATRIEPAVALRGE